MWFTLAGLSLISLVFLFRRWPGLSLPLACVVLASLGAARYQSAQPPLGDPAFVAAYNDGPEVTLEGVVVDEPDVRDQYANLRLRAQRLRPAGGDRAWRAVYGLALVQVPRLPAYGYGDRLLITGALETPPALDDFSYRDYLAQQGVHTLLRFGLAERAGEPGCRRFESLDCNPLLGAVFAFKARALQTVGLLFAEPQAALLSGILLGVESGIPEGLQDAFRSTGTTHIIAISGFNISILAGAILFLSRWLVGRSARGRAALLALAGIALYTVLVGAEASVVRAALMACLGLLARQVGRQVYAPGALAGAALVMTLVNPLTLWDVGFQLSFMATLGLILYADPVSRALTGLLARLTPLAAERRVASFTSEFAGLTLAAQITTLPLTAFYFGRLSPVSLLANVAILPAQPAVMLLGGLATLAGLLWLPLGRLLAWLAWPFVAFTIAVVERLGGLAGASLDLGRGSLPAVLGAYGLIFGLTWLASRKPEERPRWLQALWQARSANVLLGALALGAVLTWSAVVWLPDGRLHVTFLDVGQGEAVLVQTPSGEYVLLGGGPSGERLAEGLGRRMPFWERQLALVVVPGSDDERIGGLAAVLPRYTARQALLAGQPGRTAAYRDLMDGLNRRGVSILAAEAGQEFDLGDGARLKVLAVGEAGLVLRLGWGEASFLLPLGDAGESLPALAGAGEYLPSTVLLVPEQGGQGVLDRKLMEAISPWAAVISVGVAGPAAETLEVLEGYTVLRTDRNGWASFATDGKKLWAETDR